MKKIIAVLAVVVVALVGLVQTSTAGNEHHKVFVCKYVGTPGVNERLQTGQNPISVSVNAIPGFPGIGGFFADAHGRSLVVAYDTGQDEPSCPSGQGCEEDCTPPPSDVCTNIEGLQESVPEGLIASEDENGRPTCVEPPPPTDVCENLPGNQSEVPPGYMLVEGTCIPVEVPPVCTPPAMLVNGVCVFAPPTDPGVTGEATVFCDLGAQVYRVRGTIDGQAVDSVDPSTIAGTTHGDTNVTLTRGDTSFRTSVFTYGDCATAPPVTTTVTTPVNIPAVVTAPIVNPKPKPKPASKPKPKPKPKKHKVVRHKKHHKTHKVAHVCVTLKDGTHRKWYGGGNGLPAGCYPIIPGSG